VIPRAFLEFGWLARQLKAPKQKELGLVKSGDLTQKSGMAIAMENGPMRGDLPTRNSGISIAMLNYQRVDR